MGIVSKLFGDDSASARRQHASTPDYIDLTDYGAGPSGVDASAVTYIRFCEIRALEDLKHFATYVYDGAILVLDFKGVQQDEILLRRLTNELRKLAQDTGGDLAGLGDHHILLTPTGVKVDGRKLQVDKETGQVGVAPKAPKPAAPANGARPAAPRAR